MIKIILHDDDKDRILSYRESKEMVESFWEFSHGECCGVNVPYDEKECWFCHSHIEHDDKETVCDTVEWIYEPCFMGIRI
jgi:hypothetical protein